LAPFKRARPRGSAEPFSTVPMSLIRIGRPWKRTDDDVAERVDVRHPPHGAQYQLAVALIDTAAGKLDVLPAEGVAHLEDSRSRTPTSSRDRRSR